MSNSYSYEQSTTKQASLAKVFVYMFIGLLITAVSAIGIFYLIAKNIIDLEAYFGLIIISSIAVLILVFVSQFYCLKNKKGGFVTYALYAISMGILLSSLMIEFDLQFLGFIFLCTAGAFGVMALYGYFTKANTTSLRMFGIGGLFGVITLSVVNIFLQSDAMYYLISYIGLAAMLAITAFDINMAKRVADSGGMYEGMAIYLALQLYTDFIYIFLRLAVIIGRNRR